VDVSLREKQKRQTRVEIVKAAMSLFSERGFENVPVELICERSGISRATFFNYFPKKDMILASVALSRIETMRTFLDDHLRKHRKITMQDVISIFLAFCRENEELGESGKALFLQVLTKPVGRASHVAMRKQFVAALAEGLEQVRKDEQMNGDPKTVAETLFALYIGTSLEWLMDPERTRGWLTKTLERRMKLACEGLLR
jgi:AcrR family transcriptional regulator